MSESGPTAGGADEDAVTSAEWVRRRFLAACDSSHDGQPPDPDDYLNQVVEADRLQLREELESALREHLSRRRGPTIRRCAP